MSALTTEATTQRSGPGGIDAVRALAAVLSHPLCAFGTNAILLAPDHPCQNPAAHGAFPRVLGHFSRDLGLFSLEEAIRRMTSYPAERIGLTDMGRVAEGSWADVVVFDPETVSDNGWPEQRVLRA
jgi:N-acyl-D-amino-acid deacylase